MTLRGNFSYKLLHCSCIFSFILIAALLGNIDLPDAEQEIVGNLLKGTLPI
jgi:hypothetical protein